MTTGPVPDSGSAPLSVDPEAQPAAVDTTTTAEVAGDVISFNFAAQPDVAYAATVQAVYADGPAPVSNASLEATLVVEVTSSSTTSTAAVVDEGSDDQAASTTGSLPATGTDRARSVVDRNRAVGRGQVALGLSRRARSRGEVFGELG